MVEETQELPIAEEPTPTAEAEPKRNVDDLLAELEKAGVESPEQLQGKLDASAQAGKAFQMLGDERKRSEALQVEVDKLKAQPQRDEFEMPENRPIDIEAALDRSVEKQFNKRDKAARQAQEASIAAYSAITTDSNFHLVKEIWEEKIKNPTYLYQAQSGAINPLMDYQNMVVDYFKNIAKESHKTITELVGGKEVSAPHVESGEGRTPGATTNIVSEGDDKQTVHHQLLDRMHKKVATVYVLTDEEEALVAEAVLLTGGSGLE